MKEHNFKGISQNGDLSEAINVAIVKAKEALTTDHILWELDKVSGSNGGFIHENIIEVSLNVQIKN